MTDHNKKKRSREEGKEPKVANQGAAKRAKKKESLLTHLRTNVYVDLRPSLLAPEGVGVFAIRAISKGVAPFRLLDEPAEVFFVTEAELKELDPKVADKVRAFYAYDGEKKTRRVLGDLNQPACWFYVQDNKDQANLKWDRNRNHFVAARDIAVDEELACDVSLVSDPEPVLSDDS